MSSRFEPAPTKNSADSQEAPLEGVKVVDLTQFESGPAATQFMAWLGAEVIKVEPPRGDPSRSLLGGTADRDSILFGLLNQGKRSVVLDLKRDEERHVLFELLEQADVLCENFAPGTLDRLGFDSEFLRDRFPGLVIASVRGYAPGGPWAEWKSFDFVAQAVAGAISVTGEPDRPPVRIGPTVADSGAGAQLAVGILAALMRRNRTGQGGTVSISLQDAMLNLMRNAMGGMYVTGNPSERFGDAYAPSAPSGLHPCAPGGPNDYVYVLLGNRRHWDGLLRAIEREDLIGDERYSRQSLRNQKTDEVRALVSEWTCRHDKHVAMERISAEGVPCGATLDTLELLSNRQLLESGMMRSHSVPGWGELTLPGCPLVIDDRRLVPGAPPVLDQDGALIRGAPPEKETP